MLDFLRKMIIVVMFLFVATVCMAEVRPMTIDWSYSGTADSWKLFRDGVEVCTPQGDVRTYTCTGIDWTEGQSYDFTLVAVTNGVDSPSSAVYPMVANWTQTPPPATNPAILGITIL